MIDEKTLKARRFVRDVKELAQRYELPFFMVTDGASGIDNADCEAVEHARRAHMAWELKHGIDPDHDWKDNATGMKALSLWQPWAQLIVTGEKLVETRGWPTKIRGKIAIHAAKRKPDKTLHFADLPLGAVVGTVEIIDCLPIEALYGSEYDTPLERSYGDWAQGRYGWILRNPKRFDAPIPAAGHQGFWRWEA